MVAPHLLEHLGQLFRKFQYLGIGTCGKAGQGVPVGVAQPSILIDKMTVGGTQL